MCHHRVALEQAQALGHWLPVLAQVPALALAQVLARVQVQGLLQALGRQPVSPPQLHRLAIHLSYPQIR